MDSLASGRSACRGNGGGGTKQRRTPSPDKVGRCPPGLQESCRQVEVWKVCPRRRLKCVTLARRGQDRDGVIKHNRKDRIAAVAAFVSSRDRWRKPARSREENNSAGQSKPKQRRAEESKAEDSDEKFAGTVQLWRHLFSPPRKATRLIIEQQTSRVEQTRAKQGRTRTAQGRDNQSRGNHSRVEQCIAKQNRAGS